jgi:flavin-dependent dehydrogenase
MASPVDVDFLVVGAGPAGASLAAFMGQNGTKSLVVYEKLDC